MSAKDALLFAQQQRIAELEAKLSEPPRCRVSFLKCLPDRTDDWKYFYTTEQEFAQLRAALSYISNSRLCTLMRLEDVDLWFHDHDVTAYEARKIQDLLSSWDVGALSCEETLTRDWMLEILCSIYCNGALMQYKPLYDRICKLYPTNHGGSYLYKDALDIIIESTQT